MESNAITDSFLPGVIVHSNAPDDIVSGTIVRWNTISNNDWGMAEGPHATVGVAIIGAVAPVSDTFVEFNQITGEHFGVWASGAARVFVRDQQLTDVEVPSFP